MISLNDAQLKTGMTVAVGRTATSRESYVLILRPEPGIDSIRALRAALKFLLRRLGLRAVTVTEQPASRLMHPSRIIDPLAWSVPNENLPRLPVVAGRSRPRR
jgi:hypothetical protein